MSAISPAAAPIAPAPRSVLDNAKIDTVLFRLTFPAAADSTKLAGVLTYNAFGGGLEMAVNGAKLVFGEPKALDAFKVGDVVEITGRLAKQQDSIHMSGSNYAVEGASLFSGSALQKDTSGNGPGDKVWIFDNGRAVGAQG